MAGITVVNVEILTEPSARVATTVARTTVFEVVVIVGALATVVNVVSSSIPAVFVYAETIVLGLEGTTVEVIVGRITGWTVMVEVPAEVVEREVTSSLVLLVVVDVLVVTTNFDVAVSPVVVVVTATCEVGATEVVGGEELSVATVPTGLVI